MKHIMRNRFRYVTVLEIADRLFFKYMSILNAPVEKVDSMQDKMGNLSREVEIIRNNLVEML